MKTFILGLMAAAGIYVAGCGGVIPGSGYVLELPELPAAWASLLGEPEWRIEWLNPQGGKETMIVRGGAKPAVDIPQTWTNAVSAWPFWPQRNITPGFFRPAGALFPFDASGSGVSGGSLRLSWKGGVDAVLYWELALAAAGDSAAFDSKVPRLPQHFNWPWFRELFETEGINADVRRDPWLADWRSIAQKIARSGFDKRRLVPETREEVSLPVSSGPWIGTSPFAAPLIVQDGTAALFPAREAVDLWVSAEGMLRCNRNAWIFLEWE
jgi:hypothetical protein